MYNEPEHAIKYVPVPNGFRRASEKRRDKMSTSTQVSSVSPASQTNNSTPDTWENRIKTAATFMGTSTKIVEEGLKSLGVEEEPAGLEMLSDENVTPFGDIRAIFCENELYGKIPIAKVRMAMKYLRGPKDSGKTDSIDPELMALKTKYGIKLKMEDVEPSELLEHYHPEQPSHPITVALKKRFGDQAVVVFKPDSKIVDIEATANYIADLEQGYAEQETVDVDGELVRVYPIGQVPNKMVSEDPLFPGQPLKRSRSVVNRVNWENISDDSRKLCRIIVERDEIDVNDRFSVKELIKLAENFEELKKFYPEAALDYRERKQKDELPRLQMTMNETNGRKQNPFGVGNRQF